MKLIQKNRVQKSYPLGPVAYFFIFHNLYIAPTFLFYFIKLIALLNAILNAIQVE